MSGELLREMGGLPKAYWSDVEEVFGEHDRLSVGGIV
jgi:hypothetical protein